MISIDLFCQVIDNYGDIGISWRLARQLAAAPFYCRIRLWVNRLEAFSRIEPRVQTGLKQQIIDSIQVYQWETATHSCFNSYQPAEVVIETFGCTLPPELIQRFHSKPPVWINLEYLSAEPWISDFHLQPSPQGNGLKKTFFFPGFTCDTGGLLREAQLIQHRQEWMQNPNKRYVFLQQLGVETKQLEAVFHHKLSLIFLFSYPHAAINSLYKAVQDSSHPVYLLLADGTPPPGPAYSPLNYHILPFIPQAQFDYLLWSSDINFVRGEDSWIRAIWAGQPFLWQPYKQEENAHWEKLDSWLTGTQWDTSIQTLLRYWGRDDSSLFAPAFTALLNTKKQHSWKKQCQNYSERLAKQNSLAENLIDFCIKALSKGKIAD